MERGGRARRHEEWICAAHHPWSEAGCTLGPNPFFLGDLNPPVVAGIIGLQFEDFRFHP
jgi:hypothetical protein